MALESLSKGMSSDAPLSPMAIASNSLLTAREKLELLQQLKADSDGAQLNGQPGGFPPEDIDEAIAHVHDGIANGVGSKATLKGEY